MIEVALRLTLCILPPQPSTCQIVTLTSHDLRIPYTIVNRACCIERFYYERVSLEGCGCAEYVSTRLRDLDGLVVNAEVGGIAWTALPERRSVWVRLADRIRKVVERANWRPQPRFMVHRKVDGWETLAEHLS